MSVVFVDGYEVKKVLDACCGARMFWFDKNNELALFNDVRDEEHTLCDGREFNVKPDTQHSYEDLPFPDNHFKHVVFDPPHLVKGGDKSWLVLKYGKLGEDWRKSLRKGFEECFRVLDEDGTLVFKWNEDQISVKDVLELSPYKPLYGHRSGRHSKTLWICFMKNESVRIRK